MYDETKLIFYTGAAGSAWGVTANMLAENTHFPINKTDRRDNRVFQENGAHHLGAYWGPGNEHGKKFDVLNQMSKNEIIEEIDAAYTDKSWDKYRIVKSHHFSLQLDYIKETFPLAKIVIVLRPDDQCFWAWKQTGGFETITYPEYRTYYKDYPTIEKMIIQENTASRKFVKENNLDTTPTDREYLKNILGLNLDYLGVDIIKYNF